MDEKERAEHLMLVDLARNDIGRVAEFGSVSVPEFMDIEKFSHVQHIVSRVCGIIAEGKDRFDALESCFPAGTVSGAPKIRAMQIIADLESGPRGLYAGAVGYSGFADLLEFAIAIRTIRIRRGLAEFSTGAGIVADSIPEKEFEETGHKAQAMIRAIRWYLCRQYSAQEALEMGLVNRVVPQSELGKEVEAWGRELLQKAPTSLAFLKASFNADTDHAAGITAIARHALDLYYHTEESREGVQAFLEKRPPDFSKFRK